MAEHAWLKTTGLGWLHAVGNAAGLTRLAFADKAPSGAPAPGALTQGALEHLARYLQGELEALKAVSVVVSGTAFQLKVWQALQAVPAGQVISYAELAQRLGKPKAVRAVGQAVAKNPVALVVPCHRVVHADGSLGGYAHGPERKAWLLEHERSSSLAAKERTRSRLEQRAQPQTPEPLPLFELNPSMKLSLTS